MKLLFLLCLLVPAPQFQSETCQQLRPWLNFAATITDWDEQHMTYLAWRESRCLPVRSNTADSGHLQINDINLPYLSERWGFQVTSQTLMDPMYNVFAAVELFLYWERAVGDGYHPWRTS